MSVPLRVASFLREFSLTVLRVALADRHDLHVADSIGELGAVLLHTDIDIAVIDPELVAAPDLPKLLDVLSRHAGVRVVSYTAVSPMAMRAQMVMAERGHRDLVIRGFDDAPAQLRALLEGLHGNTLSNALLARLRPALDRLTPPVSRAVEELFRSPATVDSAADLSRRAGMLHRRRLYEELVQAGWQSAQILLRAARTLRAYAYLAQGGIRVREVARYLGYGTARGLANDVRAITGCLPSLLTRRLTADEFTARVARAVLRSDIDVSERLVATTALADRRSRPKKNGAIVVLQPDPASIGDLSRHHETVVLDGTRAEPGEERPAR
jgi:AraC-like DNA-binding protein